MFNKLRICSRYRYMSDIEHNPIHTKSTPFIIKDLSKFHGKKMELDFVKHNSNVKHPCAELRQTKDNSCCRSLNGKIVYQIEESLGDSLALDFVSIKMLPKVNQDKSDKESRINGRVRLQIVSDTPLPTTRYSEIIRHLDPNVSDNLMVYALGFPLHVRGDERLISLIFNQPSVYTNKELRLYNGSRTIGLYSSNDITYPSQSVQFDLSLFPNKDYSSITLRCPTFGKELTLTDPLVYVRSIHPDLFSTSILNQESSFPGSNYLQVASATRNVRNENHFEEYGIFHRYRYGSEVEKGHKTSLSLVIKNLIKYIGSKVTIDLVMWKIEETHTSAQLYMIKSYGNFFIDEQGRLVGTIDDEDLSLDFVGIVKRKNFKGEDCNNCRLRIELCDATEISKVIRNLGPKLKDAIEVEYIAFPIEPNKTKKIFIIFFKHKVACFPNEFELANGSETIKPNDRSTKSSIRSISFDVSKFRYKLLPDLVLKCRDFNLSLKIDSQTHIAKAYPELLDKADDHETELSRQSSRESMEDINLNGHPMSSPKGRVELKRQSEEKFIPTSIDGCRQSKRYRNEDGNTELDFGDLSCPAWDLLLENEDSEMVNDTLALPVTFNPYNFAVETEPDFKPIADELLAGELHLI